MKFNSLIPELSVSNIDNSLRFYCQLLGFHIDYQRVERGFAFLSLQGSQIMLEQANDAWRTGDLDYPYGRGINFQIMVDNVASLAQTLKERDYPIMVELEENWYRAGQTLVGQKEFLVMDPDGYLLRFAQDVGEKLLDDGNDDGNA